MSMGNEPVTDLDTEGDGQDHAVDPELLGIYLALEADGQVTPGDLRSVTEQVEAASGHDNERHEMVRRVPRRAGDVGSSPFVSRAEWGARPPKQPNSTNITPTGNTAHYEGPHMGLMDHSRCAGIVRGIQAYHMDGNGWNDIAYSSLECPHGVIFEGRWLGHRTAANGTNASNQTQYAHCSLIGDSDEFTDANKQALHDVVAFFQQHGSGGGLNVHHDWYATSCPGPLVTDFVHAGLPAPDQPGPAPAPGPVPAPTPPAPAPAPPAEDMGTRIRQLQRLIGVDDDGIMGPNTQRAMQHNMIGWRGFTGHDWPGNGNRDLVRWVQHQCNRKTGNTGRFGEDGQIGPNTNDGIVNVLGQRDGICGPAGFTEACR